MGKVPACLPAGWLWGAAHLGLQGLSPGLRLVRLLPAALQLLREAGQLLLQAGHVLLGLAQLLGRLRLGLDLPLPPGTHEHHHMTTTTRTRRSIVIHEGEDGVGGGEVALSRRGMNRPIG